MHHVLSTDDFTQQLRTAGLKVTPSRLSVLQALSRTHQPQTIQQIMASIGSDKTFKVTIYRVLADLKEAGLVRQVDFQQPHAFYELEDPEDHHHLVCVKCKQVEDFVGCDAEQLTKKALAQSQEFASVTSHSFELFGVCKRCQLA